MSVVNKRVAASTVSPWTVPATRLRSAIRSRPASFFPALVLGLGMLAQLVLALRYTSDFWFTRDDWHYLMERGTVPGRGVGFMAPYAGHWVAGPTIIYKVLFAFFGMRTYVPYALSTILLHLLIVVLTYRNLLRVGVSRWIAVGTTWLVVFLGAGSQAFLWAATLPLTGSLALGLVALDVILRRGYTTRGVVVAAAALIGSMMFSAAGPVCAVLLLTFVACQRGWATALRVAAPSVAVFAIWYLLRGRGSFQVFAAQGADYLSVPKYVWGGLTGSLQNAVGIDGSGPVLALLVVGGAFVIKDCPVVLRHLAWAGIAATFAQLTLTATARFTLGIESMAASRYAYIVIILLAPAIALCLGWVATRFVLEPLWVPVALVAGLVAGYTLTGLAAEDAFSKESVPGMVPWRDWAMGTRAAADAGEKILTSHPSGFLRDSADITFVNSPAIRNALPDRAATARERVNAESMFFVGVGPDTYHLFAPADVRFEVGFDSPFVPGNHCQDYHASAQPRLVLRTGQGNEIGVRSDSGKIVTKVVRDGLVGDEREWAPTPGVAQHIGTTVKDAELVVEFDAVGDYTICTN